MWKGKMIYQPGYCRYESGRGLAFDADVCAELDGRVFVGPALHGAALVNVGNR